MRKKGKNCERKKTKGRRMKGKERTNARTHTHRIYLSVNQMKGKRIRKKANKNKTNNNKQTKEDKKGQQEGYHIIFLSTVRWLFFEYTKLRILNT